MPTTSQLRADLLSAANPHAAAIAAAIQAGDLTGLPAILNDRSGPPDYPYWVEPSALVKFLATTDLYRAFQAHTADASAVAIPGGGATTIGSLILALLANIGAGKGLDLTDATIAALVDLLASTPSSTGSPLMTASQASALKALGTVARSWADTQYGYPTTLSIDQVVAALAGAK